MSGPTAALLRTCALLLCLVAGSRQLSIKEFVVPKAVELGEEAELRCQYELGPEETEDALYVKWWWEPDTGDERKQIYQRIAGHAPQTINNMNYSKIEIKNNDTIVLLAMTTVDSGTYECEVSNLEEEKRQHDTLVVFNMGTGPILNTSEIEGDLSGDGEKEDLLFIECRAEDVAPIPEMKVTVNEQEINMTTIIIDDSDDDGLYSIYANTTIDTKGLGETSVECQVFYSDPNIIHPPYSDVKTFIPAGCDMQSTTEMPEDSTQPEDTPESLQNSRDASVQLQYSWIVLTVAAIFTHLQIKL